MSREPDAPKGLMSREEELATRARAGDKAALEELIEESQALVYRLAIRMLADPIEAQDATQEILIRIVTGLSKFRGDSTFRTWVYRVASNHLLTTRKRMAEQHVESLDAMAVALATGLAAASTAGDIPIEDQLLIKEARLACTSRMLLGLDREHRLAFILGEVLELSSDEGAQVLQIESAAFRKRLSRARDRMAEFTARSCGLVDAANPCRCEMQAARLIRLGHFDPQRPCWTAHPAKPTSEATAQVNAIGGMERMLQLFRGHPDYTAPEALAEAIRKLIEMDASGLMS